MRLRLAFALPLLIISGSWIPAGAQTTWTVETEKGKKVQITSVEAIHLVFSSEGTYVETGKDSAGNPLRSYRGSQYQTRRTTTLPLRPGDGFGFRFQLPHIDAGDAIVLALKTEMPVPVKGQRVVDWGFQYGSKDSGKAQNLYWKFRPENPHYHVPGRWVHNIYNKGKLLTTQAFTITRP